MKGGIGWDEWYLLVLEKWKFCHYKVKIGWLNPKFEYFWQFGNIMVECDIWTYVWRFYFSCIYFDNFEQLSAPVMNFVQLSATFANALHIVLCQIVWCQIVLKSSKCSNFNIFKCSTFLMFQCSNNQMFKFSNIKMFKCLNVQIFKYSNVPIFQRFNVPMFQWSNVQMFKCWNI